MSDSTKGLVFLLAFMAASFLVGFYRGSKWQKGRK